MFRQNRDARATAARPPNVRRAKFAQKMRGKLKQSACLMSHTPGIEMKRCAGEMLRVYATPRGGNVPAGASTRCVEALSREKESPASASACRHENGKQQ